jgi:hypothetical protein
VQGSLKDSELVKLRRYRTFALSLREGIGSLCHGVFKQASQVCTQEEEFRGATLGHS